MRHDEGRLLRLRSNLVSRLAVGLVVHPCRASLGDTVVTMHDEHAVSVRALRDRADDLWPDRDDPGVLSELVCVLARLRAMQSEERSS